MLIFKRRRGEGVRVGDWEVTVLEAHRSWVKLGVTAPTSVAVERCELVATERAPAPKGPAEVIKRR